MRIPDMSKTAGTHEHEHESSEQKGHACRGGDHTKDQKAQPAHKQQAVPSNDPKHEHAHKVGGHSGCCGGGKASK